MSKDPKITLNRLIKYSTTTNPKFTKLYSCLYSIDFFKLAYQNIYAKPGNMTPASDQSTIDGMSEERINKLIQKLRDGTYQPTNLRRVNIPKKKGGTRPISVPSVDDKLVQEIIRMILEAIYEKTFSEHSHGFRPKRSCHTALDYLQTKFPGTKWFIEGDIKGCFDNINHERLLQILRERIYDLKFIHLINLFLKAGYIENWEYHKTYSGTPQGSIISPILANIYLDKFDKFMEEKIKEFHKGKIQKHSNEYFRRMSRITNTKQRLRKGINVEKNKIRLKENIKELKRYRGPARDMYDPNYRRLKYVRYADDFLIGIVGSRKDTEILNESVKDFFKSELKLELSPDKHKITHNSVKIRFLGYDIIVVRKDNNKRRNGMIWLSVPYDVMVKFIIDNRYGKWWNNPRSGKDELKAIHRPELIHLDEYEILLQYNWKLRGLYNYYSLAENVYKFNGFGYICLTSLMRTLAAKYKISINKLCRNKNYMQRIKGTEYFGVTKSGKFYPFFIGPFERKIQNKDFDDVLPNIYKLTGRNSLIKRLESKECEFCGNTEGPFEIHHVKKLKDLKGKFNWEKLMIARKRKTLVLCVSCHHKLHAGKL